MIIIIVITFLLIIGFFLVKALTLKPVFIVHDVTLTTGFENILFTLNPFGTGPVWNRRGEREVGVVDGAREPA